MQFSSMLRTSGSASTAVSVAGSSISAATASSRPLSKTCSMRTVLLPLPPLPPLLPPALALAEPPRARREAAKARVRAPRAEALEDCE